MNCSHCGTPSVRAEQRFCAGCGSDLAAATQPGVEPPPAYHPPARVTGPLFADDPSTRSAPGGPLPPPPVPAYAAMPPQQPAAAPQPPLPAYDDGRRDRRRTSVLLLVVAALVAALIGAAGVVLLFGNDDDDRASDTSAEDRGDKIDATTEATTDATTDDGGATTATATATDSENAEPASFRCWHGGPLVTRPVDCAPPTGQAGLAWVFPSSDESTCSPSVAVQRAAEVDCSPLVDGDPVRFHYSEWRSREALENYYGGNTVATIASPGGRGDLTAARVASRASDVGYKVAVYYADSTALWSVTIYAADEAQYLAAVGLLEARPFGQLRGERE